MTVTSKLPDAGTTIFSVMTNLVTEYDAEDNHVLRFCFAKNDETLEQAAERLCRI